LAKNQLLNELKEKVLLEYIIDLDSREFSPKLEAVKDMVNHIFASQSQQHVGKF